MRLKIWIFIALVAMAGCTKKAKYPGKALNPFLPSIHEKHGQPKKAEQNKKTEKKQIRFGVIAVVNTRRKTYVVYINKKGQPHYRLAKKVFLNDGEGKPEPWEINRIFVKKTAGIKFKKPIAFDTLHAGNKKVMSGAGILNDIKDQVSHRRKDDPTDFSQWMYSKTYSFFGYGLGTITLQVEEKQYLPGAAHPDATTSLVTLDTRTKKKVVFAKQFSMSTLIKEANSHRRLDKCLSSFDSVVPIQGRGGVLKWVASFNHKFSYCNGMIDFRVVGPPPGFQQQANNSPCKLKGDSLYDADGKLIVKSVWDYRASPDCSRVVYIKKNRPSDRYRLLNFLKNRYKRRDLYLLLPKSGKRLLLGRTSGLLSVDFPDYQAVKDYTP